MRRDPKFTGLDVHTATIVATVERQTGKPLMRSVLPTEAGAILEFFGGMRGPIQVAFEEGTQAQWLYDLLRPVVDEVVVCNRRGQKQQGNHGDFRDADGLADDLRKGNLKPVYHAGDGREKTASAFPKSHKASRPQDPGLIAKALPPQRSARRSLALDDRSHRTRSNEATMSASGRPKRRGGRRTRQV